MIALSTLSFGSLWGYTPRPETDEQRKSKTLMYDLKQDKGNPRTIESAVSELTKHNFKNFFGPEVALVPVPKSSLMKKGTLWTPLRIAQEMERQGLGIVSACLERTTPVPKAATAQSELRPKVRDHIASITLKPSLHMPERIVLVDDIVTRGSTLLGCANVFKRQYPDADIKGFAIIRTISNPEEFRSITDPVKGTIRLQGVETFRNP